PISTINRYLGDDRIRTSPVDALLPHLDYFLNQYAEHVASCILHAHPIYYQVGQKCRHEEPGKGKCEDGFIIWEEAGQMHRNTCPSCKGSGVNLHKDASTVLIIPAKDEQGAAFNIQNVAGYVTPPIEILAHQMKEL